MGRAVQLSTSWLALSTSWKLCDSAANAQSPSHNAGTQALDLTRGMFSSAARLHLTHMQLFLQEGIPTSLLKLSTDNSSRAVKMFSGIQKYMDSGDDLPMAVRTDIAQKLLHQGLKRPELKDELYMQLLKQSRGNPNPATAGDPLLCGPCTCLCSALVEACACQFCRAFYCQVQPWELGT